MKKSIIIMLLVVKALTANAQNKNEKTVIFSDDASSICNDSSGSGKNTTSYYYFPNMQVYFDLEKKMYHYQVGKDWLTSEELPLYYGGYSLFKNERVMVYIAKDEAPQNYIKQHRKEFPYNPKGRIKRPSSAMVPENSTASLQ
ncbi:hypothetical protein [Flavobacterium sp. N1994]|uniref:hypothetical protein n=1 Tax=Flavobacterium sp. N1994 TaxID=2986827 RepID=UPI002223CF88|nr:hypothetical protein [Flavobacterium sp. N1994]